MLRILAVGMTVAVATVLILPRVRAEDASNLNARVCNNISLPQRDRNACAKDMQAARTDEDRAKVRKEYEQKIVDARAKKSGGS